MERKRKEVEKAVRDALSHDHHGRLADLEIDVLKIAEPKAFLKSELVSIQLVADVVSTSSCLLWLCTTVAKL